MLLTLCCFTVAAQTIQDETLKTQLLKDWMRAKNYTREYLDAMPADHYTFRPTDSVRTFGQQMLHLAFANVACAMIATGYHDSAVLLVLLNPNIERSPKAGNKDSVTRYVNMSYDYMMTAIRNFDFSKLNEIVKQHTAGGDRSEMRFAWLMKGFEHQTHTRGQCAVYLRLSGILPPTEKLF
ncbi:MAG: damage-inducible protein DinB [Bacteroidetes bacterium]|nr:MAG: damage-inducible protein DinB [Bacteroidota bacterium]